MARALVITELSRLCISLQTVVRHLLLVVVQRAPRPTVPHVRSSGQLNPTYHANPLVHHAKLPTELIEINLPRFLGFTSPKATIAHLSSKLSRLHVPHASATQKARDNLIAVSQPRLFAEACLSFVHG